MSFDAALALTSAQLSRIAYHPLDQAERDIGPMGLTGFQKFSGTSTQAFIAQDGVLRYLVFRGTESTNHIDWMRDAQFKPVTGVFGTQVHSGFRRALDEVWDDILPHVNNDDRGLVVTGHSLGGGLTTLAAASLVAAGHNVDDVNTQGPPRSTL